jgi:hypothetical protein
MEREWNHQILSDIDREATNAFGLGLISRDVYDRAQERLNQLDEILAPAPELTDVKEAVRDPRWDRRDALEMALRVAAPGTPHESIIEAAKRFAAYLDS